MASDNATAQPRVYRAALISTLAVLSIETAHAYVDPGTGSMMLQMGIAALAGAMFFLRQLRMQAIDWFRRVILRRPDGGVADAPVTSASHDPD